MLELYHYEPTTNSGEVLILLKEKGIDFVSRYVDVLAFEQLDPEFLKVNPQGQVPVLVHDRKVVTETGFILQYLEATFHTPSFTPHDAKGRYWVNVWIKYVNEYLAPAAWKLGLGRDGGRRDPAVGREALARAPLERQQGWDKALGGQSAADLEIARALLPTRLAHVEAALAAHEWLAGEHYSIADIAVFPTLAALPGLVPDLVNETAAPKAMAWLERVRARPPVQEALAYARSEAPEAMFAPGPEGSRWG